MSTDFAPKPTIATATSTPVAGQRLAVAGSAVKLAAFNALTNLVIVDVQGNDMYVTFDGRTPSSSAGGQLYAGNSYAWNVATAQTAQFIQQSAAGTVDVQEFASIIGVTQMPDVNVLKPKPGSGGVGLFTNLTVNGTSNLIGGVTMGSTLGVTGAATFSSSLTVSGSGAVNLGSGTTTVGGNLAVTGTSTLTGNVTFGSASGGIEVASANAGTNLTTLQFNNTGGNAQIGLDNSAGTGIYSGITTAYNLVIGHATRGVVIASNGTQAVFFDTGQNATFAKAVTVSAAYSDKLTTLTYASPTSVTVGSGNVFETTTVNATGSVTFNASGTGLAGQHMYLIIINDATSGKTITFGTNFRAASTLVGVPSKASTIEFVSDGTSWFEVSRITGTL